MVSLCADVGLSAEMMIEKAFQSAVEIEHILLVLETMSLVVLDHVLDFDVTAAQRGYDLIRFLLAHSRVIRALRHEERHADSIGVEQRRGLPEPCRVAFWMFHHHV